MTLQAKSRFLSLQTTLVFCIIIYLSIGGAGALRKHFNSAGNTISKRNVNYNSQRPTISLPYKTGIVPTTPEYGYDDPSNKDQYEEVHDSYAQPTYSPPEVPSYSPQEYVFQTHSTPIYNAPTYTPSEYDDIYNSGEYDSPTYSPSDSYSPTYSSPESDDVYIPDYDAPTYSTSEEDYYDYDGPTNNGPHLSYGNSDNEEQVSPQPLLPSNIGGYGNALGQGGYGNALGLGGYGNALGQGGYGNALRRMFGYGGLPHTNYGGITPYAFPQPIQPIVPYPALTLPNYYPGQLYMPTVAATG